MKFSENLNVASAETIANYAISGGVTVLSATWVQADMTVELATTAHAPGPFTLTASNITDLFGNVIDPISTSYNVVVPTQIIVDNTDAGFSIVSGLWGTATRPSYGGSFRYARRGTGASVAQWTTALGMPGQWRVEVWWPNFKGGTNVPYTVMHDGGTDTFQVNQKNHNANQWNSLGDFTFSGGTATVQLSNLANGWVFADAVRFTYIG